MATKRTTTKRSPAKKPTKPLNSLKKNRNSKTGRGGARSGAGRKPIEQTPQALTFQEFARNHSEEEITHTFQDHTGKTITVQKSRNEFLLDRLYEMGFKEKQIKAVDLYFQRAHGKAIQPMHHSGQVGSPEQTKETPRDKALEKAIEAYEKYT